MLITSKKEVKKEVVGMLLCQYSIIINSSCGQHMWVNNTLLMIIDIFV